MDVTCEGSPAEVTQFLSLLPSIPNPEQTRICRKCHGEIEPDRRSNALYCKKCASSSSTPRSQDPIHPLNQGLNQQQLGSKKGGDLGIRDLMEWDAIVGVYEGLPAVFSTEDIASLLTTQTDYPSQFSSLLFDLFLDHVNFDCVNVSGLIHKSFPGDTNMLPSQERITTNDQYSTPNGDSLEPTP